MELEQATGASIAQLWAAVEPHLQEAASLDVCRFAIRHKHTKQILGCEDGDRNDFADPQDVSRLLSPMWQSRYRERHQ